MSGILNTIQTLAGTVQEKAQNVLDSLFPPEKRAEMFSRLQAFAVNNPKLSAFLLTNFALTGLPLVMFAVFTLTVFVFSLVAALLVAVLVALLATAFMVGIALLVVLPTIFLTTMGASFLFLWGLGGYYIMKWFNQGGDGPAAKGTAIGDKLNNLTGGRLDFLMNDTRSQAYKNGAEKKDEKSEGEKSPNSSGEEKRKPRKINQAADVGNAKENVGNAKDQVEKTANTDGVKKRLGNSTGTATSAAGAANGAVGGATGLT
ncbi:uncharacterized protein BKCO1_30006 [Diplodia corticola]|uniref:Uncharacterized protein n=1 Tax=Diplodia corticola TaxID=236234 RepID=A0A1J9SH88_9PEZI|nr:uncharacterized protein BKCO1_30006 [Diplodia corticola]OJD38949.1 hypothetical protein BKCO1_30006 [Diplodia corticola]